MSAFFNRTDAAWHHAVIVNTADAWAVAADACEEEGLNTSAGIARGFAETRRCLPEARTERT